MARDIELGDRVEFRQDRGGVAVGDVIAVGAQQSTTSIRVEDGVLVAWQEMRREHNGSPADVTFVPFWNARLISRSARDRVLAANADGAVMARSSARRVSLGVPTPIEAAIGLPACPECKALRGDPCRTPGDRTRHPHAGRYRVAKMQGIVPWFERGGAK